MLHIYNVSAAARADAAKTTQRVVSDRLVRCLDLNFQFSQVKNKYVVQQSVSAIEDEDIMSYIYETNSKYHTTTVCTVSIYST